MANPARAAKPHWFSASTLRSAFRKGGCAICNAVLDFERRSIHSFLYEGMMSPDVRAQFLEGGGFCQRHFGMAKEIEEQCWPAGGIGLAILCQDLVRRAQKDAGRWQPKPARPLRRLSLKRDPVQHAPRPGSECSFCRDRERKEESLAEALEELVEADEYFVRELERHPLCLRHTRVAVERWHDPGRREQVIRQLHQSADDLAAQLQEFIAKHDYQHRGEPLGRVQGVVPRAMRFLAGGTPPKKAKKEDER